MQMLTYMNIYLLEVLHHLLRLLAIYIYMFGRYRVYKLLPPFQNSIRFMMLIDSYNI
jgi:hypothetical protein